MSRQQSDAQQASQPAISGPGVRLVVKATAGSDDPERCNQAFMVAATALAAGAQVSLWLTGEAAWLAVPGRAEQFELPQASPLSQFARCRAGRRHA